jgi:hypothetical protein
MKTTKMSLANIQGKLSRAEMKNIMAGSGLTWKVKCNDGNLYVVSDCTASSQSTACSTHGGVVAGASCTGY